MSSTWFPQIRSQLLGQGLYLSGDHYGIAYTSVEASINTYGITNPPVTLHGTPGGDYDAFTGAYNKIIGNINALTPLVSCTPGYHVTGFDIIYVDYTSTGSWSYNVDGGSNTTVTCTGADTSAGAVVKKVQIRGLTSGTHTLNINSGAVANSILFAGITCYASTSSGIVFANLGWPAVGIAGGSMYMTDSSFSPPDRLALYQGYTGTTASPTALSGFGVPMQPDLAICGFVINDAFQVASLADFENATRRMVHSLRYGKSDACSILFLGPYVFNSNAASSTVIAASDGTGSTVPGIQEYYDCLRQVAQEYCCAYASIHTAFGQKPVTNGWVVSTSNFHPSDSGHTKMASLIGSVL